MAQILDDPVRAHLSAAGAKGAASRWNPEAREQEAVRQRGLKAARDQRDQAILDELRRIREELAELRASQTAA